MTRLSAPPRPLPGSPLALLRSEARRLGFSEVGVTDLAPFPLAAQRARRALSEGRLEGMPWYTEERIHQAADLGRRFPWGRSLVALAYPYRPTEAAPVLGGRPRGRIAAYALSEDYHRRLDRALRQLVARLRQDWPGVRSHRFVDHGRAFDRAIAERAGLGFSGKNTQLLTRSQGSYVLLASLVLNLDLEPDRPSRRSCGRCRACLPSCPTGALVAPGVMDARRCISYLTIEHEGPIPAALRHLMGTWVFGCDLCQEACPVNRRLAPLPLPAGGGGTRRGPVAAPDLVELLRLSEAGFRNRFRNTTLWRSGRERLCRNAAIALGNAGDLGAVPALARTMARDPSWVVRGACAWALGQIGGDQARTHLRRVRTREEHPEVREEVGRALMRPAETTTAGAPLPRPRVWA